MEILVAVLGVALVGAVLALAAARQQRTAVEALLRAARDELTAQTEAGARALDTRNELMDQRIDGMHRELDRVRALVADLERDRQQRFGELTEHLSRTGEATAELAALTRTLREALASPQARGQWGERLAEDVLRTAGMVEGVTYVRQAATRRGRPDFTFLLPGGRSLHMDVKFPLDNYLRLLEATSDADRERFERAFLRDARARVRELTGRDYVDPAQGTLDHVLLFIPNEHVYAFLHERDRDLVDLALRSKVVLCSPLTLFSVLAVIREAVDSFAFERRSGEVLDRLHAFAGQWGRFVAAFDELGGRLDQLRREYDTLATTRRRALDRELERIDELRRAHGEPDGAAGTLLPLHASPDAGRAGDRDVDRDPDRDADSA